MVGATLVNTPYDARVYIYRENIDIGVCEHRTHSSVCEARESRGVNHERAAP